jgi:tryptophan-rich sensory protein
LVAFRVHTGIAKDNHMHKPLSRAKQVVGLIGWLLLSFFAAGIGGLASVQAASFYQQLAQPSWAPPTAV